MFQRKGATGTVKTVALRLMIQVMVVSSSRRESMARLRPKTRPVFCWASGRRPTRMEMNTMLSMPRTISRRVRVVRAAHALGSEN